MLTELPDRDPDQKALARDVFVATCELALEQLQAAAELLDAGTLDDAGDTFTDDCLRSDVADGLVAVRFFQEIGAQCGRPTPIALTAALRLLTPRRPATLARRWPRVARRWPAVLSGFWLQRSLDSLEYLGEDFELTAAIVFRSLADLIEGESADVPTHTAAEQAILAYLDDADPGRQRRRRKAARP